ncbi:MAG TPA: hypothetical protein VJT85_04630 [Gemmatimonadaceae bacterium]|nr:hypothetical protein [Gemmatimonadaceae bacterium]
MASLALRQRSPSEIVDAAFQIMRAHFAQFVMCSAIGYLPWLVIDIVRASDPSRALDINIGANLLLLLGFWLVFALMGAVLTVCASQAYLGEQVDVGAAVRQALPRWPLVLIAAVLRFAMVIFGLFFFFIGALYPAARFFAVTPAIVLEGVGLGTSFGRASALSKGRKWHIILTMGLAFIIYLVVAFGIVLSAQLFGSLVVQVILMAIFTIVGYPVVAITGTVLYYDLRIRSEGLDIELMAGALETAPSREAAAP